MQKLNISPRKLYEGCLQAAVTHAVAVGMYPELNYEHFWDGMNYCANNSQGCKAVITFHSEHIVAVFQDADSADPQVDALSFFEGAPEDIIELAKSEALQYMLENVGGTVRPVITSAFWGTWTQLNSACSFDGIAENGGHILAAHLLPFDAAMEEWDEYYELDEIQMALIRKLFERKISSDGGALYLQDDEVRCLYGDAGECLASLAELGFVRK